MHPGGSIVTQTLSDSAAGEGGRRRNLNSATANETATATESPRFATLHVAAIPAQYTFAHIDQAVSGRMQGPNECGSPASTWASSSSRRCSLSAATGQPDPKTRLVPQPGSGAARHRPLSLVRARTRTRRNSPA